MFEPEIVRVGSALRLAAACMAVMALAGCGGGKNDRGVNTALGTSSTTASVALTSSTGLSTLNAGETLVLNATVTNDTNTAGVTWVLDGAGTLTNVTNTTATYNAPATVSGTTTPAVNAVSIADANQAATATLVVTGTPVIYPIPFFPASLNAAYSASVSVAGGLAPYVWALNSGTLPAGITLGGLTGNFETVGGTPTETGSFPFQMKVTDANSATATVNLTLVVNAAASCLINGHYALLMTGSTSSTWTTRALSVNVDSSGAITGISDRKVGGGTNAAESITGTCANRVNNSGVLNITASSESPSYNFSVTTSLSNGRVQLTNGGINQSGTGELYQQSPAAFNLAALTGNFSFGLQGADSGEHHHGIAGQITLASNGTVTAGRMDSNAATAITNANLTGSASAPDTNGRGVLTLNGGGQTLTLAYYVITANRLLLINTDTSASAPRLVGYMTRRAAAFTASSMNTAAILSLWGSSGISQPISVLSVGRFSAASSATGAISLTLDTASHDQVAAGLTATAGSFVVEADGRTTVSYTLNGTSHQLLAYLDAMSNGYVIERNSSIGAAGLIEMQMPGPFDNTVPGLFVSGTQFHAASTPLALLPVVYISSGNISASSGSGAVAIASATGRGLGSFSISGVGGSLINLYIVNPNKLIMLRYGGTGLNPAIEWLLN